MPEDEWRRILRQFFVLAAITILIVVCNIWDITLIKVQVVGR